MRRAACKTMRWPGVTNTNMNDRDTSAVVFGAAEEGVTDTRHKTALRTGISRRTIEKPDSSHHLFCLKKPATGNRVSPTSWDTQQSIVKGWPECRLWEPVALLCPRGHGTEAWGCWSPVCKPTNLCGWFPPTPEGLSLKPETNSSALLTDSTTWGKLCKKILPVQSIRLRM